MRLYQSVMFMNVITGPKSVKEKHETVRRRKQVTLR